jgi:hypothetical protein
MSCNVQDDRDGRSNVNKPRLDNDRLVFPDEPDPAYWWHLTLFGLVSLIVTLIAILGVLVMNAVIG